jgi:hypothetical protein
MDTLLLAALFREKVIATFVTLNFDLVPLKALSDVGAMDDVAIIRGPEEHGNHRANDVVFLHRSVDAPADQWILRTEQLDTAWRNGWEELVALRVVSNPITIFVGLGTPAAVLIESVSKVRAAVPGGTHVYQVDVNDKEASAYFAALHLADENYIQMGWTQFMEQLSDRVLAEQRLDLERSCREAPAAGELDDADLNVIVARVTATGLLALGRIRAEWLMKSSGYHPALEPDLPFIASVLIAVQVVSELASKIASNKHLLDYIPQNEMDVIAREITRTLHMPEDKRRVSPSGACRISVGYENNPPEERTDWHPSWDRLPRFPVKCSG